MNWKSKLSFASAILTFVIVGTLSYRAVIDSGESQQWVAHTHAVIENLLELSIALKDQEASYRKFVLTGVDSDLDSDEADRASLARHTLRLRQLILDNPTQQGRMPAVENDIQNKLVFAGQVISMRRLKGGEAAAELVRGGNGAAIMRNFESLICAMEQDELGLLAKRDRAAKDSLRRTETLLIVAFAFGSLISLAAAWSVDREGSGRTRAERAQLLSEERFRRLLEAAPDSMVVVDERGRIVLINFQTERLFERSRDDLIGAEIQTIIPLGVESFRFENGPDAATVERVGQIEAVGRRRGGGGHGNSGVSFAIDVKLSPMDSPQGRLVICAVRDITERKRAEIKLALTLEELKRSNIELQQFAHVASHDLQEPLRMVASYTQLLARRYRGRLDSDADEFIGLAVDGCSRMKGLIQDLLELSQFGTRQRVMAMTATERAVKGALINLGSMIRESGAVVLVGSLPEIVTDGAQLLQVFQNLISNAIKYRSAEAPSIKIGATQGMPIEGLSAAGADADWVFSVADNGQGIDPAYFERIFVLFERLHGPQQYDGNGIGLAICKKIVERLGGRIWVNSEVGKGATFYFSLPAMGPEARMGEAQLFRTDVVKPGRALPVLL